MTPVLSIGVFYIAFTHAIAGRQNFFIYNFLLYLENFMDPLDIAGLGVDAFKLGYNIYTNKRDFDYQKALQQTMFEREDTAVQRRMADLQAAGLNPNLAGGSGAGAGAVVSRSNTNDLGSALDTVQAINSIKAQRQQVDNAKVEYDILKAKKQEEDRNNKLDYLITLKQLGFNPDVYLLKDGEFAIEYQAGKRQKNNMIFDSIDYQAQNNKNSADLLQKELNWYTVGQLANVINSGIGAVSGAVNAGSNAYRAANTIKRFR